jgi:hypothetical protein
MSRAPFEPMGRSAALENLVAIAELREVRVMAAKWPHEARQWGGPILLVNRDGRHIGVAQSIDDAQTLVRRVKVRHD